MHPSPSSGHVRTAEPDDGNPASNVQTLPPDCRLGQARRVRKPSQFQDAYRNGRRRTGRFMVMWIWQPPDAALRLGVVASRRVGGSVERSRAKRRLREAFRRNRHRFAGAVDVVLIARRAILDARWDRLQEELLALAARHRILPRPPGKEE